jgi:hypothetical protein
LSILFSTEILLGKKNEVPMKLSVRQQVDSEIHNLKRNLESARGDVPWKLLEKSEKDIQSVRSHNPRQFDKDEIYMDTLMNSLVEIPRRNEFKIDECEDYRSSIISHFDPQNEEKPAPPVEQALEILYLLCR